LTRPGLCNEKWAWLRRDVVENSGGRRKKSYPPRRRPKMVRLHNGPTIIGVFIKPGKGQNNCYTFGWGPFFVQADKPGGPFEGGDSRLLEGDAD